MFETYFQKLDHTHFQTWYRCSTLIHEWLNFDPHTATRDNCNDTKTHQHFFTKANKNTNSNTPTHTPTTKAKRPPTSRSLCVRHAAARQNVERAVERAARRLQARVVHRKVAGHEQWRMECALRRRLVLSTSHSTKPFSSHKETRKNRHKHKHQQT